MHPRIGAKHFAADETELRELEVKLWSCPHCGRTGALIGHGWLRGYAERDREQVVRGRRFFCSNRFRRPGCGRTFSVLLCSLLRGFTVRAETLLRFVEQVALGHVRRAAWQVAAARALTLSSGYRLWRRLADAQVRLRARLCRECPPPDCTYDEPLAGLLAHFRAAYATTNCALSIFQLRTGDDLLD